MTIYTLTIDDQPRDIIISDDLLPGLTSAMDRVNATIEKDEDKWTDASKYFESVLQGHGDDLQNVVDRALRSYNGLPEPTQEADAPADVVAVVTPVTVVTNYQAREALRLAGKFATVNAAVKSIGEDSSEYQAWEYANNLYRDSPLIRAMAGALGFSDAEIDALFTAAKQIN